MRLYDWLRKVGFTDNRHPFASGQADNLQDALLQSYFVEHPAYQEILDIGHPRSAIIHAHRGAGKSSHRRMFEMHCTAQPPPARVLIIQLLDWDDVIQRVGSITAVDVHTFRDEILRQGVCALANTSEEGLCTPTDPDLSGMLNWLCVTYEQYLSPGERRRLEQRGWLTTRSPPDLIDYNLNKYSVLRAMQYFAEIVQVLGFTECHVVIDEIDETPDTISNWQAGADLLTPLIARLNMFEVPHLYLKCFIPSEIFDILLSAQTLRKDHMKCIHLAWDGEDGLQRLRDMLICRLRACSNNQIVSLAELATLDFSLIDEQLCRAAEASPRRMIELGDQMFSLCAAEARDDDLLLKPRHLVTAEQQLSEQGELALSVPPTPNTSVASARTLEKPPVRTPPSPPQSEPPPATPAIPPLSIGNDGRIWRGNVEIPGGHDLPQRQRELLTYLYQHRLTICLKEDLIRHLYDGTAEDTALPKLAKRLAHFIEPDPQNPVYLGKIRGGHLILENTAEAAPHPAGMNLGQTLDP